MQHRTGSVYSVVLLASLVVASMTMAAVNATYRYSRGLNEETEYLENQITADAGLEFAIASINNLSDWRDDLENNVDTGARFLGQASLRFRLIDTDGDLNDDPLDACDLIVTTHSGNSQFAWRASLEPAGAPLNCLDYAICSQSNISVQSFGAWSTDGNVAADGNIAAASTGSLAADSFAGGNVSGNVFGNNGTLVSELAMPDSVVDQYQSIGTEILITELPAQSGVRILDKQLLSPNANSINGQLNPLGIYYIDCNGEEIRISNSRLNCTLALRNVAGGSRVQDSVYWEPSQANYPALIADNDFDFAMDATPLNEAAAQTNFNPPGTPYRGLEDSTQTTVYPSCIRGLIFIDGRAECTNVLGRNRILGCLIATDEIKGPGDFYVEYSNVFAQHPPPGFRSFSKVRIAPGSVHRVPVPN